MSGQASVPDQQRSLTVEELQELLAGMDGVDSLEVDLRDEDSPVLRLHLDTSSSIEDVRAEIEKAVRSTEGPVSSRTPERRGLGRALADILAADGHLSSSAQHARVEEPEPDPSPVLSLVAVEETVGGISVRAADTAGGVAFSPVEDPKSLNQAVVSAVARLRQQRPLPRLAGVEVRDVEGAPVLTVVLVLEGGVRKVGSCLVEGGMPFTLGRAVWEALASHQ